MVEFFEEISTIANADTTVFIENIEDLQDAILALSERATVESLPELYSSHLGVNLQTAIDYFDVLDDQKYYITNSNNRALLIDAITYYGCNGPYFDSIQSRLFFGWFTGVAGIGCAGEVIGGILDTAISGAGTIIISPTGGGFVLGAIGTASYYANTVTTAIRCGQGL